MRGLIRQFHDIGREAQCLGDGLTDLQFNWRPGVGRWSVAECFGHLNIVGSELLPVFDSAVAQARDLGWRGSGPFRPGFVARWLLRAMEPPARPRRRAPERHVPPADQRAGEGIAALVDLFGQLGSRLQAAAGLDLAKPRVAAPVKLPLRIGVFELLLLFAAHARRHLAQAREVRGRADFGYGVASRPAPRPSARVGRRR